MEGAALCSQVSPLTAHSAGSARDPGYTPSLERPVPAALLPWPLLDLPELQASGPVPTALDFWAEFSSHPKPLSPRPSTKGRSCVMGLLLGPQLVLSQDPLTRSPGFSRVPLQMAPAEGHGQEELEPRPQGNRAASESAVESPPQRAACPRGTGLPSQSSSPWSWVLPGPHSLPPGAQGPPKGAPSADGCQITLGAG